MDTNSGTPDSTGIIDDSDSDSDYQQWKRKFNTCWKEDIHPLYNGLGELLGEVISNGRWVHAVDRKNKCIHCGLSLDIIGLQGECHLSSIKWGSNDPVISIFIVRPR